VNGRPFPVLLIAAGAVVALLCLGGIVFGFVGVGRRDSGQPRPTATIGQPVRDRVLEFTVNSVHCGQTSVGSGPAMPTPAGQFCVVAIRVHNVGTQQETFADQNQKALSPQGTQYFDDSVAGIMASPDNPLAEALDPGRQLDVTLVYDIPTNVRIDRLQLHDSAFSDGVEVALG
jgi:hypothetical protein